MPIHIIEFKARVADIDAKEALLRSLNPVFKGEDRQVDTYFNVKEGRLKLREGNIENALIWYNRANTAGSKLSEVLLHKHNPGTALKEILLKLHGVKVVVDKKRRIYFIDNVKFHFDEVQGLGQFIEVEAIDETGELGQEKLQQQCDYYAAMFAINAENYIAFSYSDLLLERQSTIADFPELKTDRLLLRQIVASDIQHVFKGLSNPDVIKHYAVSFHTLEATQEQMDWYANMIKDDTGRCWAICSADNKIFYGICTLSSWNKQHRKAETGYWLLPDFWGKGIVPEALQAVFNYGFEEMNLHRIMAEVEDDNPASIAVLKKLGFTKEGTFKECKIKDGRYISLYVFSLLNNR
jgi:ribosomal-protein-alanine N-acetyltransferase